MTDQARGINDPGLLMAERHVDESRIRKLAKLVIGPREAEAA